MIEPISVGRSCPTDRRPRVDRARPTDARLSRRWIRTRTSSAPAFRTYNTVSRVRQLAQSIWPPVFHVKHDRVSSTQALLCAPHADAGPPRRAQTPVLLRSSTLEVVGRPLFPRRGHQRGIHVSTCHSPTPGQGAGWHRSARPCLSVAPCCTKAGATPLSYRDAGTVFRSPTLPAKPTGITHRSREHHSNPELAPCGTHDRPPGDGPGRSRGVRSSRSPHRVPRGARRLVSRETG